MKATDGDRKGGQECGLRICNQKYMMNNSGEKDGVKYCVLIRCGVPGGATVVKTAKTLCVGVWDGKTAQSDNKMQTTGACQD